ncbi:MAG TPA: alpha-L-rhamnosidase C-terminal domain-containing protein, partial [Bacteroidales bacterium]|nr:alpha-L-rhamnosidase C-terminal domain-containing protein [Bacteroidales bacterium]
GIFPDKKAPGFINVILRPIFPEGLENFRATHEGPYGTIISEWKQAGDAIEYHTSIPPNSTATLLLEAERVEKGDEEIEGKDTEGDLKQFQINLPPGDHSFIILTGKSRKE